MRRLFFAFVLASTTAYASAVVMTDPTLIKTTDIVNWGLQFGGGDLTPVSQTFFVESSNYENFTGSLASGSGVVKVAGTDAPATGGFAAGDDLLATNGSGPLTFYLSPVYGVDAFLQAAGSGQFTARIQAFSGLNSVLDMSVSSDAAGDPLYLGVSDSTAEITKVVYSLTQVSNGLTTDFLMDSLLVQNQPYTPPPPPLVPQTPVPLLSPVQAQAGAPEPGTLSLIGGALLGLAVALRKRIARV